MVSRISVRGAREHNLKNVHLSLPRDKLIVITGLSGSGKSSLAFDTIYAEGQRRYVESLSAYARQFLELMQKPDVDHIDGLSPAISIEQKTTSKNPRSTVATVTEIYDYMRLLWARIGVPYSPATGLPIEAQTVSQMVDRLFREKEDVRFLILAPIVRDRKGEYRKEVQNLKRQGYQRLKVDGVFYEIDDFPALDKKVKHSIDVVIDRLVLRADQDQLHQRLADSLETTLKLSDGLAVIEFPDKPEEEQRMIFSQRFSCPTSGFTLPEIEPRLFSFNNPHGACPTCDGLGKKLVFDLDLVVPDQDLSLAKGAIAPWSKSAQPAAYYLQALVSVAMAYKESAHTPWKDLKPETRQAVLYGTGDREISMTYEDGRRRYEVVKSFEGVMNNLERRWRDTDSNWIREELSRFQKASPCDSCGGKRLKQEALCVKVADATIADICELSVADALNWFTSLEPKLKEKHRLIAEKVLRELIERLGFLNGVGLEYLTLDRSSGTLSGGESQRIRLASQIGSGLTGVLYVLDEPSIGLHQRDNDRLLATLRRLRDTGNTVIVVEHDEDAIRAADYIVDMGPGAGIHGGEVVAQGSLDDIMGCSKSLTGAYLSQKKMIPVPESRRQPSPKHWMTIKGARSNNLKNISARFPIGLFCCVTGVSGSGKSTLTIDTLYKSASRRVMRSRSLPGDHDTIEGLEYFDKVIDIDQSPIGRTPRSNPATYTGAFTPIREWFAGLPGAKMRGYKPGRFSFNVKGGRCEACQGDGVLKIEMHFLPDVYVTCDVCQGKRYNRETLEVTYRGKSIADILDMTVEDGVEFFKAVPSVRSKLEMLEQVGLGYIHIGQQATSLSGGEAQRIKLSKELSRRATGKTLYILDEPTTGLHFDDVKKLLKVLHTLVDQGNTIIVIEHNLDVIKTADWIVDLGPEGGEFGGRIVAQGSPEEVASTLESYTGRYLASMLPGICAANDRSPRKKTDKKPNSKSKTVKGKIPRTKAAGGAGKKARRRQRTA